MFAHRPSIPSSASCLEWSVGKEIYLTGRYNTNFCCLLKCGLNCQFMFCVSAELNDLYSIPNIVRVVKSRRMRWAGHVARMGEDRGVQRVLVGKPEGKRPRGDQDIDGRIILRWIFRKLEGVVGTGWSWLRIGTGGGHLWVRWRTFGFHKCWEFLD